jgi:hypothetical protein
MARDITERRAWDSNPQALSSSGFQDRELPSNLIPIRSSLCFSAPQLARLVLSHSFGAPQRNATRMATRTGLLRVCVSRFPVREHVPSAQTYPGATEGSRASSALRAIRPRLMAMVAIQIEKVTLPTSVT